MSALSERLFAGFQHCLPHHPLSRLVGRLAECEHPAVKDFLIRKFIDHYRVDMVEAEQPDPAAYPNFNAFFTRALRDGARPLAEPEATVLCPADGAISQIGSIQDGRLLQAKGREFSVGELLGGDEEREAQFASGSFATVYLSPRDYHRLHMPVAGRLRQMIHVPGRLFSVNAGTARAVPNLFARNERVAAIFETEVGPMALVLVGAIIVASIETVWHGVVTPPTGKGVSLWDYSNDSIFLDRGAEMGRFRLGSTIIVLFGGDGVNWEASWAEGSPIRMGSLLGTCSGR
ncbi:MAG: phosphatidylserine decarboxylase [Methylococcaceae bacterium]|nr:phosphatidylserine decarboxylase [Methylococcaceae bacterium]